MPTLEHNGLVDMFRENPALAPHLLELLFHLDLPPYATVAVVEASLDQLTPVEFRADLALELRDARGALVLSIVLEVQRDKDPRKKYSWPVYVVVARAQKQCPTIVLVVAPDAEVAAWASEKIDLGLGRGSVEPLVVGPAVVPVVTDQALAEQETELAILSAAAHGNGPHGLEVALAALGALGRYDHEHAAVYFQIVYNALREPLRRALEALIMERQTEGKATFPPFAQQLIDRGKREGLQEGKREGLQEGKREGLQEGKREGLQEGKREGLQEGKREGLQEGERKGKLEGKQDALLRLLARAGIALTADERARIQGCTDAATLDRWIENVIGAKSASDVLS
ncbi:Yae1 family protein [Chondromyces apiculatus]|nr:Yae1 family protein [Chondromyces apiculatus]